MAVVVLIARAQAATTLLPFLIVLARPTPARSSEALPAINGEVVLAKNCVDLPAKLFVAAKHRPKTSVSGLALALALLAAMAYHLVTFMSHRLSLLAKVHESASKELAEKVQRETVLCFRNKFQSYKPSMEEVNALHEQLENDNALTETSKLEMMTTLHLAEVAAPLVMQADCRQGAQTCNTFYNYLTKLDWEALEHPKLEAANKISILANRMISLGMMWASEKCYSHALAVGLAGQGFLTREQIEAAQGEPGLALVRELKQQIELELRLMEGQIRASPTKRLREYPDTPDKLPQEFLDAAARKTPRAMQLKPTKTHQVIRISSVMFKTTETHRDSDNQFQKGID